MAAAQSQVAVQDQLMIEADFRELMVLLTQKRFSAKDQHQESKCFLQKGRSLASAIVTRLYSIGLPHELVDKVRQPDRAEEIEPGEREPIWVDLSGEQADLSMLVDAHHVAAGDIMQHDGGL
jgi:hypothetical protein